MCQCLRGSSATLSHIIIPHWSAAQYGESIRWPGPYHGHMATPATILTVCTGNVCRSPYLERRLQHEVDASWGAGQFEVASAGTGALVGAPMDPLSLQRLSARGGVGDGFAARQVTPQIVGENQLVIVASREHRTAVTRLYPKALGRTHTFLDLAQLADQVSDQELAALPSAPAEYLGGLVKLIASKRALVPPLTPEQALVHDPFGQGQADFDQMQTQIEDALPHVVRVLGKRA